MNGLSLFSGIGGIDIALEEWVKPVMYCEIEPYCQAVLLSRMADESLPNAPIWDDIRTLSGLPFSGSIDIIYGGFPCQDISIAGLGKGLEGERSGLFFEIIRLCSEIKPRFIFLENVPAITYRGGTEVVRKITSMGYDSRWCIISAAYVGAPHRRERWFFMAHSNSQPSWKTDKTSESLTFEKRTWVGYTRQIGDGFSNIYWEESQHPSPGMDDGLLYELDRAKAIGNAVVPDQTRAAFQILSGIK